ncbi:MAG: RNA polymerase sigma-70 factor [Flavobacteriaceae bacterium]|nr:RNA polymerase sigma-70 factor [Flavobacteriaceae bacterium]
MKETNHNLNHTLSALKKGDKQAFKTIYDNNIVGLIAFINGYTKSKPQAEDIVQETFIKLWKVRETLDLNISIKGFLYKTAYNSFIDNHRKKKRELKMLDNWMHTRLMELTMEDEDIKGKKIKLMIKAIEELPPKCKEIFVLSKFEHLKYSEIAKKLNISIKTVEAQMGRAFSLIRKEFKGNDFLNLFLCFTKKFLMIKIDLKNQSSI